MTSDLLKRVCITGKLTRVFRSIADEEEIPDDWKILKQFQYVKRSGIFWSVENIEELIYWSME